MAKKKQLQIGDKVKMGPRLISWNLSHEHYECCSWQGQLAANSKYDEHIQLTLLAAMGGPVTGTITRTGNMGCWGVTWRLGKLQYSEYNDGPQLILVRSA